MVLLEPLPCQQGIVWRDILQLEFRWLWSCQSTQLSRESRLVGSAHIREVILFKNGLGLLFLLRVFLPLDISFPAVKLLGEAGLLPFYVEGDGVRFSWCHVCCSNDINTTAVEIGAVGRRQASLDGGLGPSPLLCACSSFLIRLSWLQIWRTGMQPMRGPMAVPVWQPCNRSSQHRQTDRGSMDRVEQVHPHHVGRTDSAKQDTLIGVPCCASQSRVVRVRVAPAYQRSCWSAWAWLKP